MQWKTLYRLLENRVTVSSFSLTSATFQKLDSCFYASLEGIHRYIRNRIVLLIPTSINLSVQKFVILWKKLTIFKILQSLTFLHPGLHFTELKVCLMESYAAGCLLNYTPRNFSNYVQHERVIMQIRYPFIHQDPVV